VYLAISIGFIGKVRNLQKIKSQLLRRLAEPAFSTIGILLIRRSLRFHGKGFGGDLIATV